MPKLSPDPGHTNPGQRSDPVGQPTPGARETKMRHGLSVRAPSEYPIPGPTERGPCPFKRLFICELVLWLLLGNTGGILRLDEPVHLPHFVADRDEFLQLLRR